MKIGLFLNAQPSDGGAFQYSRSVLAALTALPKERFSSFSVFTNRNWTGPLSDAALPSIYLSTGLWGIPARKLISGFIPLAFWRRSIALLHPTIKMMAHQACHFWIFPAQDTWTYLCPFPALGTVYDLMHRYERRFPEVSAKGNYESRERHYRSLCRWSKAVMVDSNMGKRQLIDSYGVSPDKVFILPFVSATRPIDPGPDNAARIIRLYKLPEKFFFYPAQFWEHKNHRMLVSALNVLRDRVPDMKIVFSGAEKNGYKTVRKQVEEQALANRVLFLGLVPDEHMPYLYKQARALIMPTFFGPTNIPPLEAMAWGCPVAVSDVYAMRVQLGDAALYFHPASIQDITTIMERLWKDDDLCRALTQRGLQHHVAWNQEHFNQRFQDIIDRVLAMAGNVL